MNARAVTLVTMAAALVVAGCTGGDPARPPVVTVGSGELRLASFDSCDQALGDLREKLLPQVGPYGLAYGGRDRGGVAVDAVPPMAESAAGADARAQAPGATSDEDTSGSGHSTTNTHEAGVDEPDVVKTDGRRIVTVVDGQLRVVDAATRTLTASLVLPTPYGADELLLSGDNALVIRSGGYAIAQPASDPGDVDVMPVDGPMSGAQVLLVSLAGRPTVRGTFSIDGRFVDARMVGSTVRVVTHSEPRLRFGYPETPDDEPNSLRRNRDVVSQSTVDDWLPRYELRQGGAVQAGRVDCSSVARPVDYSATSMLTVLSFDLGSGTLGTGDPVTIVADGDVVYGTAGSLYVASDANRAWIMRGGGLDLPQSPGSPAPPQERTELYKFDTTGTGRPRHVASGAVPGTLLNQYSLSEFDGHLRVATTLGGAAGVSSVYVLAQRGTTLEKVGEVGGLGKDERIYAVRFIGPLGYVVTFRQTDPLYTLDLRTPTAPRVTGELKITGYSAYLHPAGDGRLIGVGQEASEQGRALGTQVSLFDVADPTAPSRVAQYHLPDSSSEAEHDPHAFLYWPATGTLVLPLVTYTDRGMSDTSATVLRVSDGGLTEVGRIGRPGTAPYPMPITRSLVIGDTLWTLAADGLAAHDLTTLTTQAWVGSAP
jgi:uncharacterized secreted protein with C-terminal beta-propeller domain